MPSPLISATKFLNGVPQVPEVVGGSGREYFTPQTAIDSEIAQLFLDVTGAATREGLVKSTPAFIPSDGFYDGMELVITDLAAVKGGIAQTATIQRSVAATNDLFLSRQWNAGVGKTYAIVKPVKIALNRSFPDDVLTVTKDVEINLGGNTVKQINVTGAVRYLKVLNGVVRNGISWASTAVGVLVLDNAKVNWRSGTPGDAVRMAPVAAAHGLEIFNSRIEGRCSGASNLTRWILDNVSNPGFPTSPGRYSDAFSVVNARGVALAPTNVSLIADRVDGSVAMYHAESAGDITLGTFTDMRCYISGDPTVIAGTATPAKQVTLGQADDTSTMALAITDVSSIVDINMAIFGDFAILRGRDSSGACSVSDIVGVNTEIFQSAGTSSIIKTEGVCSGAKTVALGGNTTFDLTDAVNMLGFQFTGAWTGLGSITAGGVVTVQNAGMFSPISFAADQIVGAPTATYAPTTFLLGVGFINIFNLEAGVTVSAGTWTDSAQHWGKKIDTYHCTLPTILANEATIQGIVGGASTWFRTGDDDMGMATPGDSIIRRARNAAPVPLICSGGARFFGGGHIGTQVCTATTVPGASTTTSGPTFFTHQAFAGFGGFAMAGFAGVAGAVATSTGEVTYTHCNFADTGMVGVNAVAGAGLTIPAIFRVRYSGFAGTYTLMTGAGAIVGAGTAFHVKNRYEDSYTINGSKFVTFIAEECIFNGSPDAFIFVTLDPTTFWLFKCTFPRGRFFTTTASLVLGKPIIFDDIINMDAHLAIAAFRALELKGTFKVAESDATTDNIVGFSQAAQPVIGGPVPILATGFGFMQSSAFLITVNDALEPDAVAGGFVKTASVKRLGYAVTGTTGIGVETLYGRINVDR